MSSEKWRISSQPGVSLLDCALCDLCLVSHPAQVYVKPFIIMSVIPFAFIGAIWGHQIMKLAGLVSGLAMMSILGMIAAAGVVVVSSLFWCMPSISVGMRVARWPMQWYAATSDADRLC